MSEDWPFKHHIRIPAENINKRLKKTRKPPYVKQKENEEHGENLKTQLENTIVYCNRENKLFEEDYVLTVRTENPISIEENVINRLGFIFSFQINENVAVVTLDKKLLNNLYSELNIYAETNKLRSYYNRILSIEIPQFNKLSNELLAWMTTKEKKDIEIELLPNLGEKKYSNILSEFLTFFEKENLEFHNSRIRENSSSIKAKLTPQSVQKIVEGADSVWHVKQASEILTSEPQGFDTSISLIPDEAQEAARPICVLDTGVDCDHPLLVNAIIDHIDLTPDNLSKDIVGHGTFVSGIAAYGELEDKRIFSPSAKIISVKVQQKNQTPKPYLETYIEEAVQRYHNSTKIFNLSVMYPSRSNSSIPSELAYTIDYLSRKYDIVFVVCSGNLKEEITQINLNHYPTYFSDEKCVIYCGADSSTCISVGGVSGKESAFSIAKREHPSPFTRRGHFSSRAKPDVVSWAGNMECSPSGSPLDNPLLHVISLGLSPNILASDIGTSFSTARISNLIAKLQNEYPLASANLLKALIIHFSTWPLEQYTLNASNNLKKALYGKGIPTFNRCAFSTRYSASYIVEDEVQYDEESIVPIFVPDNMRSIYGEKIMKVTLVFDPPVNRGALNYNLVDLDFKLYKEERIQRNWDNFFRNKWDNVKTDTFRWQKSGWGIDWIIRIIPRTRFNVKLNELGLESQKYALIVTLEDPSQKIDVYNAIQNRTRMVPQTLEAYLEKVSVSSFIPLNKSLA